jgi:tight adherence protein B
MPEFNFDPRWIVLILIFAAVFTGVQAVTGLARVGAARRKVNKRLATVEKTGSLEQLVGELRKQRGLTADGEVARGMGWFNDLVIRSGVNVQLKKHLPMTLLGAALVSAIAFLWTKNWIIAAVAGPALGVIVPVLYLKIKAAGRQKAIGLQLPNALEVIIRSLEAGHPVPTAIALVGREMPDPLGSEFGMAGDEIAYGATLQQAIGRIADRCRHPDVDLFAATIRLQEKSGGNLTGLLKMNAKAVRERHKMRLKIKAASSEGRASAIILTSAPFGVLAILSVMSPQFYGGVIGERPVQIGLCVLGVWMFIGNMVMRKMIDMRI